MSRIPPSPAAWLSRQRRVPRPEKPGGDGSPSRGSVSGHGEPTFLSRKSRFSSKSQPTFPLPYSRASLRPPPSSSSHLRKEPCRKTTGPALSELPESPWDNGKGENAASPLRGQRCSSLGMQGGDWGSRGIFPGCELRFSSKSDLLCHERCWVWCLLPPHPTAASRRSRLSPDPAWHGGKNKQHRNCPKS